MLSKENIEEQVIDNQSRLIRMQKEDTLPSSSQQILQLPEGFTIGKAIGRGDCFFDAVAQGLNQLKPWTNCTVKSLREVCRKQAFSSQEMKKKIIADARNRGDSKVVLPEPGIDDDKLWNAYLASIEYTAEYIERIETQEPHLYKSLTNLKYGSTLQVPICGRPEIEGRMICNEYNVKLHVIEDLPVYGWSGHLMDGLAFKPVSTDYNEKDTIHIINKGGFHFEPILKGTAEQVLSYYYDTWASEKKLDSESVCFQQNSEKEMTDNQMGWERSSTNVEISHAESTIVDYKNRLSSEELQRERSQEGPRAIRSSSISSSTWYSASNDTATSVSFTGDEVVERETYFVKAFVEVFEEKLSQYSKEAKPGSQIQGLDKIATQSISITNNLIPPNPLRLVLLKLCEGVGFFSAQMHRKESKEVYAIVNEMDLEGMRKILVEAGLEIFQSFECQFVGVMDVGGSSWKRGIKKLAMDAVYRVMNYLSTCSKKEDFSVNLITKGLILGKSRGNTLTQCVFSRPVELFIKNNDKRTKPFVLKSKISSNLRKLQPGYRIQGGQGNNELFVTSQLYTEVGIKKIDNDIIEYYQLRKHNNAEKYGYRLFFSWELEKWRNESIDKKYKLVITPEEQYVYILNNRTKEKLANILLKEINGNDSMKRKHIQDLHEEIEDLRIRHEKEDKNTFSFNLEHLPQFFVERRNMLKMLNEKLNIKKQEEIPRMILIHGGYGVGKSELAKSYAHSIKSKGNVVWINATSCSTLSNSFYSLAKKLGIPTEGYKGIQKINYGMEGKGLVDYNDVQKKNIESIVYNVYEKLQDVESYFIFDNTSQYKEIKKFLPPYGFIFGGKQPYVLITSRNKNREEEMEKINLNDGFSLGETVTFIERTLEIKDRSQNRCLVELAEALNYLPLALTQATAYIKQAKINVSEYLKIYNEEMQKPNPNRFDVLGLTKELFITLMLNLDKIKREENVGQQSNDILASMAYLSPGPINTVEFFFQEKSEKDQQDASNALNLLDKFSMIELDESTAKIHEGVQKTIIIEEERMGITEEILRKTMTSTMGGTTSVDHIISVWSYASKYKKLVNDFINSLYDRSTILHLLAKGGNEKVIKLILEKIEPNKLSEVINAIDKIKCTPLDCAAMYGHLKIVKCFIEKGSDLDGGNRDLTPLHWAAVYGQLEVVKYFIDNKYWKVDKLSGEGGTPLHYAVISGNIDLIKYLVEKGADVNLQDETAGLLHFAAQDGRLDIVQYLIEKGASVNLHDRNGMCPLHHAIKNGFLDIAKCLITRGADINLKDENDMSPLCYGTESDKLDIVQYIVEQSTGNLCKKNVMSFLYYGAEDDRLDIAEYLIEKEISIILNKSDKVSMDFFRFDDFYDRLNNIKSLIMQSTMVDPLNKEGMSALYLATIYGRLDLIEQLVRGGADVNEQGREGMCPLHVATACNHLNIIDYLITKGADINKKNREGLIPLHIAVIHGHLGSVKYLVEKGADIHLEDKCDVSPLLYALSITIGCPNISFRLINHCSSLAQGIDVNSLLNTLLNNHALVICYPRAQSLALDLRLQSHKGHQKRSTYFSESKKRKLENISIKCEENASNTQLLQGSQNLPLNISMQFEDLVDRTKSMININSEMPAYSFDSVALEAVNNKNLRR